VCVALMAGCWMEAVRLSKNMAGRPRFVSSPPINKREPSLLSPLRPPPPPLALRCCLTSVEIQSVLPHRVPPHHVGSRMLADISYCLYPSRVRRGLHALPGISPRLAPRSRSAPQDSVSGGFSHRTTHASPSPRVPHARDSFDLC
jgi:hypothetical protein